MTMAGKREITREGGMVTSEKEGDYVEKELVSVLMVALNRPLFSPQDSVVDSVQVFAAVVLDD